MALLGPLVKIKMKNKSTPPLIIKKYENRRLYNTLTSQYINQDQVAQLVREGHDLQVIDAATGEDLTRLILAQIVLEDAKTPDSVFPLDVLRQMIVASGKATQENALLYAKFMMDVYQNAYRAMPSPVNPFEMMASYWPHPPRRRLPTDFESRGRRRRRQSPPYGREENAQRGGERRGRTAEANRRTGGSAITQKTRRKRGA